MKERPLISTNQETRTKETSTKRPRRRLATTTSGKDVESRRRLTNEQELLIKEVYRYLLSIPDQPNE
ncbi:MAG: hypothetical protein M3R24_26820 [Chloroflexota bacterium]|nr:hypothetical protein [Chloroflexota bacterium]